jgi:hypothetical protein
MGRVHRRRRSREALRVSKLPTQSSALCHAATGLVYLVMAGAVWKTANSIARHTNVAPISIPSKVVILKPEDGHIRLVRMQDVICLVRLQWIIAHNCRVPTERFFRIRRNSRWDDHFVAGLDRNRTAAKGAKPIIGLLHGILANEQFAYTGSTNRRGFPVVYPRNVYPHLFVSDNVRSVFGRSVFERPNVRTLINLKLSSVVGDIFAQHTSLPGGDSGVEQNSKQTDPFKNKSLCFTPSVISAFGVVCGGICLALGSVLFLFVCGRVGRNGTTNNNVMLVFGFAAPAALF